MKVFHTLVLFCSLFFTPAKVIAQSGTADSCVEYDIYQDLSCTGEPVNSVKSPVWSGPGSPCVHPAQALFGSYDNVWCDGGSYHQTTYFHSERCHRPWYLPFFMSHKVDFVYTPGVCYLGQKLKSCSIGACWVHLFSLDWMPSVFASCHYQVLYSFSNSERAEVVILFTFCISVINNRKSWNSVFF